MNLFRYIYFQDNENADKTNSIHFVGLLLRGMLRPLPQEWPQVGRYQKLLAIYYLHKVMNTNDVDFMWWYSYICVQFQVIVNYWSLVWLKFPNMDDILNNLNVWRSVLNPLIEPWWCRVPKIMREFLHLKFTFSPLNERGPCTVPSGRFNG